MEKASEVKLRGRLGEHKDDATEVRILNRIVRITGRGLRYEADPPHLEMLARSRGLGGPNVTKCSTPGIKDFDEDTTADGARPVEGESLVSQVLSKEKPRTQVSVLQRSCLTLFMFPSSSRPSA